MIYDDRVPLEPSDPATKPLAAAWDLSLIWPDSLTTGYSGFCVAFVWGLAVALSATGPLLPRTDQQLLCVGCEA